MNRGRDMTYYDQVKEAADAIHSRVPEIPKIAIVLGSGLGDFAGSLEAAVSMPYHELPHWPASRVVGHEGRLVVGLSRGRTIAALAGRCHMYEGHDLRTVTFAVRVLGLLGVKNLILTNAAGGVNTGFSQGALMSIDDHINLMGNNPLVGDHSQAGRVEVGHIGKSRTESIVIRANERVVAYEIDVIVDHHQRALRKAGVHAAGGVGQNQCLHAEEPEGADREGDGFQVVSLVDVRAARQRRDRASLDVPDHQPSLVTDDT